MNIFFNVVSLIFLLRRLTIEQHDAWIDSCTISGPTYVLKPLYRFCLEVIIYPDDTFVATAKYVIVMLKLVLTFHG